MTLQITLTTELENRLRQEAERSGQGQETVALRVLDEHLPPAPDARRDAAISLLRGWAEEDAALSSEALAGNAEVLQALDADRSSKRKLFAEILEDKR